MRHSADHPARYVPSPEEPLPFRWSAELRSHGAGVRDFTSFRHSIELAVYPHALLSLCYGVFCCSNEVESKTC